MKSNYKNHMSITIKLLFSMTTCNKKHRHVEGRTEGETLIAVKTSQEKPFVLH